METHLYTFAIIGVGPRGGYALECLIATLAKYERAHDVCIYLFEDLSTVGNGPVYRLDQPESNWVNTPERGIVLNGREEITLAEISVPAFPSYLEWANLGFKKWPQDCPDTFPPRSKIGRYLHERCRSLIDALLGADIITFVNEKVEAMLANEKNYSIVTQTGATYVADDVLVTIGHQPTQDDNLIKNWKKFARANPNVVFHAGVYPVAELNPALNSDGHIHVAIRGYGLAMIDAARSLSSRYGVFETVKGTDNLTYKRSDTKLVIAPFSLDGMTMGPKPYSSKIDAQYTPSLTDLKTLFTDLSDEDGQRRAGASDWLIDKLIPVIAKVFDRLENKVAYKGSAAANYVTTLSSWLQDPCFSDGLIMPKDEHPSVTLQRFIGMAMNAKPVYLDYCAGQVWRHCQPTIYKSLSHSELDNDAMADIIALDERFKRYSFGPPVASLKQLKALFDAGVLNLEVLRDPNITSDIDGWTLQTKRAAFTATTMIDSVLDCPKISQVTSRLLESLLDKNFIQPVHDELGIQTDEYGYVLSERDDDVVNIAILGRIAKGSVIGVDTIRECFGERPRAWAEKAVIKMKR